MGPDQSADERPTIELGEGGSAPSSGRSASSSDGETSEPLGIDSEVALARARGRLAGREPIPITVGRYRIVERLGRGGMGVVYAAHDDELERTVAIKILHADTAKSEDGRRRLLREAQAMAKLSHPNVGHVYEVGHHGDQVFIAMEMVRGATLRQWCSAHGRTWRDVLRVHIAAGEGLAAAHAVGLVHRDYKCENVLVGDDGRPRVLDFGLARPDALLSGPTDPTTAVNPATGSFASSSSSSLSEEITRAGTVIGTPAYMAPEQLAGAMVDARADQYSFCVALFECLYGQRPFRGSTVSQLVDQHGREPPVSVDLRAFGVPHAVHAAILRGLRAEPERRHPSMTHLLAVLREHEVERPRSRKLAATVGLLTAAAAATAIGVRLRGDANAIATTEPADDAAKSDAADGWEAIVAASDLPPVIETPLAGDPAGVTVHRLRNGLTVYVASRPGEPFIQAHVAVRAAANDEAQGQEGLASLTLWALESGSERLGTRDFAREQPHLARQHELLAQLAGERNEGAREELMRRIAAAQEDGDAIANPAEFHIALDHLGVRDHITAIDYSILANNVPRNRFDAWVAITAEVLRHPVFRDFASFAADKLEMDRHYGENDIARAMTARELPRAIGHEDPVRSAENLRRLPLADVQRFHATYYRPNNTAIVLVGDITATEALPVISAAFGDWEPAPVPKPLDPGPALTGKRVVQIEDGGPPIVHFAWPLPPKSSTQRPAFDDLAAALGGPDGVLARMLADRGLDIVPMTEAWPSLFAISAPPPPDREASLAKTEQAVLESLYLLADDDAPDDAWTRALARQELEASRWATSPESLARVMSESFTERRAWADVAAHLARPAASRAALVAAVRDLLAHGLLVVQQATGEPSTLEVPPLPFTLPAPSDELGPWARGLVDAPVTPLEPQFLAAGRHFEESSYGAGRTITAKDRGPIFRLEWVFPIGTASDPWACDAVRAQVRAHQRDDALRGLDVATRCRPSETIIEVLGVATHLDDVWPGLLALVRADELDGEAVRQYVDETLALREQVRTHAVARTEALHSWALLGEHGVDGALPDDRRFGHDGPSALPRTWTALQRFDPDVLYVGPDPERLRELLPAPRDRAAPPAQAIAFRHVDRPTVFLLADPGRDAADVRIALVPDGIDARARLFGELVDAYPGVKPQIDVRTWHPTGLGPIDPVFVQGRSVHVRGFRCANRDVPSILGAVLRKTPPVRESFAVARARMDASFRGFRVPTQRVPEYVRMWRALGSSVDPRLEPWLALGGVSFEDFAAHTRELSALVPIISVVADPDDLDLDALTLSGRVVRVHIDDLLRDPVLDDARIYEYPAE